MSTTVNFYHRARKKMYVITPVVTTIEINGSVERYYRTASIQIAERLEVPYDTGERVRVYQDKKLLFDGRVFRVDHSAKNGITLVCHDNAYYLTKNVLDLSYHRNWANKKYQEATVSEMFGHICKKLGIKQGFTKRSGKSYTNISYISEDVQTILQGLIGMERRETGKRYFVRANGDKLEFRERGAIEGLMIDTDMTYDISSSIDAENVYNEIFVAGTESRTIIGTESKATGSTSIASSYYKGPDGNEYQSGFASGLK